MLGASSPHACSQCQLTSSTRALSWGRMPPPLLVCFAGGAEGAWRVDSVAPVTGESLPFAPRVDVLEGDAAAAAAAQGAPDAPAWRLSGVVSSLKYATRAELVEMNAKGQPALRRPACTRAALIPIRKNAAWWALAQDERRDIMTSGGHVSPHGVAALPAVARRLHHCRELGGGASAPFDFLTWFEYAPEDEAVFDALLAALRATPEWTYVDREVDIRLTRADA